MSHSNQPEPDFLAFTREKQTIDKGFYDGAVAALKEAGVTSLEFLANNPRVSKTELAKRLNRGATALGLLMVIYSEAERAGVVRDVAKDLLMRQILAEFPDGWTSRDKVRPFVKLGTWDQMLRKYVLDPRVGMYALQISKVLTQLEEPPEGWLPNYPRDQRLDELFDRYWPIRPSATSE